MVSIKVVYEIDDDQLASLVKFLTAFPHLKSLQLKSPMITDTGALHLKVLTQLHSLSLEQAAITDVGLMDLKALSGLEELNLKGTKVSDAGVEEFRKVLPAVKVPR